MFWPGQNNNAQCGNAIFFASGISRSVMLGLTRIAEIDVFCALEATLSICFEANGNFEDYMHCAQHDIDDIGMVISYTIRHNTWPSTCTATLSSCQTKWSHITGAPA